jgi:RimJ/RimL family protein N-acetyltransferase
MTDSAGQAKTEGSAGAYSERVPDATLETLARSLNREGIRYGFGTLDFIRLVNLLLDLAATPDRSSRAGNTARRGANGGEASVPPIAGLPCTSGRVGLRQLDLKADAPLLRHWLQDPHGRYFLLCCATARFNSCEELLEHNAEHAAIITVDGGRPVGTIAYLDYNPAQRKAELRKLIGDPEVRGQGYAREATALWIRYGFEVLDLRKIYLHTLDTALRNIHLNESLGFAVEGILRNEIVLDGRERDVLRMGLCRTAHRSEAQPGDGAGDTQPAVDPSSLRGARL